MSSEGSEEPEEDVVEEEDSVRKSRDKVSKYLNYRPATNPAKSINVQSTRCDLTEKNYQMSNKSVPEMDFRNLSDISDTQYLTHGIHKHPAVFIPQIPDYIINTFTSNQNSKGGRPLVLDPYNGSGTTGIEAKVGGRDYLGIEINPLSKMVSEVATTPIPPSVLEQVESDIVNELKTSEQRIYPEFDVEFPGKTRKEHWFERRAIRDLTRIRKAVSEHFDKSIEYEGLLSQVERSIVNDLDITENSLEQAVSRWLVLMIANTVFDVSNADPKVSKAHKSETMREQIDHGEHPPKNIIQLYANHIHESRVKLLDLWEKIYGNRDYSSRENRAVQSALLASNRAHKAEVDIRLNDARSFDLRDEKRKADIALTSPPYINAINYYRGTKLRLFWISDFLENRFNPTKLRQSIVGTNSAGVSETDRELPAQIRDVWIGSETEYAETSLPDLDDDIRSIHNGSLSEAKRRAFTTWRFFAEDMLQSISRTYEHLRPGAYFFLIIGENTIGGRHIQSHRFVADIASNLGKFDHEMSGGNFHVNEGFKVNGIAIDEISTRDLFEQRNHRSGVIEHEWVVILQKPVNDNFNTQ